MNARSPYLVSGLGHAAVLALFLALAALQPAPRLVPGVKIVALSGRSRNGPSATTGAPRAVPKVEPRPEPAPPPPPVASKPVPKPVDKAPPQRDKPKPADARGALPAKRPEIVSKTPAKPAAAAAAAATAPAATRPAAAGAATPGAGRGARAGVGLEAEGEGDTGMASEYLSLLRDKVASNWQPPAAVEHPGEVRAVVFFTIARGGGSPQQLVVQSASGSSSFDRAALRAVLDAAPLQPLPQQWPYESIGVKFTFFQQY